VTTECLNFAWEQTLPAATKLVLLFIGNQVDFGQEFDLSEDNISRLARFSDQSDRAAEASIEVLVDGGFLRWVAPAGSVYKVFLIRPPR